MNARSVHAWQWREGAVDRCQDHFELRYGSADASGDWLPVALVGPASRQSFVVEFLIDRADENHQEIVKEVVGELDFYLVAKGEPDPWTYAKYHCGTAANVYSALGVLSHQVLTSRCSRRGPAGRAADRRRWTRPSHKSSDGVHGYALSRGVLRRGDRFDDWAHG